MRSETALIKKILIHVSQIGWRLFRNNVGQAWTGKVGEDGHLSFRNRDTYYIELYDARPLRYGLCVGSSDLIGWRTVQITSDMVGQRIAQFCAVEAKTVNMRAPTEEQRNFLRQVAKAGGYAAVVRDKDGILRFEEVCNGNQNHSDMRLRKDA